MINLVDFRKVLVEQVIKIELPDKAKELLIVESNGDVTHLVINRELWENITDWGVRVKD